VFEYKTSLPKASYED